MSKFVVSIFVIGLLVSACASTPTDTGATQPLQAETGQSVSQEASAQPEPATARPEEVARICASLRDSLNGKAGDFMRDPGSSQVRPLASVLAADSSAEDLAPIIKDMQALGSWMESEHNEDVAELTYAYIAQGMDPGKAIKKATKDSGPLREASVQRFLAAMVPISGPAPRDFTSIKTDLELTCASR